MSVVANVVGGGVAGGVFGGFLFGGFLFSPTPSFLRGFAIIATIRVLAILAFAGTARLRWHHERHHPWHHPWHHTGHHPWHGHRYWFFTVFASVLLYFLHLLHHLHLHFHQF